MIRAGPDCARVSVLGQASTRRTRAWAAAQSARQVRQGKREDTTDAFECDPGFVRMRGVLLEDGLCAWLPRARMDAACQVW